MVKDAPDEVKNSITQVDKTKIKLSDELTQDREVLESVSYLYNLANQNLMNMDYYACVAYGHSIVVFSGNDSGYADSREYIVKDKENHCADHGIQQQLKKEFKAKLKNFEYQEDNKQYDNKCYYTGPRHTQFLLWQQLLRLFCAFGFKSRTALVQ